MKNAGMAGAVALVGIGLITIGLSNFATRAEAHALGVTPPLHGATSCDWAEEETWFAAAGLPVCQDFRPGPWTGDLDGDGTTDAWEAADVQGQFQRTTDSAYWSMPGHNGNTTTIQWEKGEFVAVRKFVMQATLDWHLEQTLAIVGPDTDYNVTLILVGLADVDGDGRRDLILDRRISGIGFSFASNFVHLNITGGEPLVADINRDGFVNAEDLGLLIAAWTG